MSRRVHSLIPGDSWDRIRPKDRQRFARLVRGLNKLIQDVREYESGANYYLAGDLNLMIGEAHEGSCGKDHQERVACSMAVDYADGGGW